MIYKETFDKRDYEGIIACSGEDITDAMIDACFELDDQFFHDEYIYNRDIVRKWIKKENRLCFVVIDTIKKKLVGYTFLFPISVNLLKSYANKELTYKDMTEDDVLKMESGYSYNILYASEAFYPQYGINQLHQIVNEVMVRAIGNLAKKENIAIKGIMFDAVCLYDEKASKMLQLEFVGKTKADTDLYYGKFVPEKIFHKLYISEKLKYVYETPEIQEILTKTK